MSDLSCPRHVSPIFRDRVYVHATFHRFICNRVHVHDRGVDMDTGAHLVRVHDNRTLLVTVVERSLWRVSMFGRNSSARRAARLSSAFNVEFGT